MTDRMTPEQRHRCMASIGSRGTKPELAVRRWLWTHGYRYRLNVSSVPGKPDIVMRPYRTAIFVNGCFWHGHHVELGNGDEPIENSACCKIPATNRDFWLEKIRRNQQRDQRNYRLLSDNGWQVIVVWECQLKPALLDRTMRQVELLLNTNILAIHSAATPVIPTHHIPIPYSTDDDAPLPMVAEDDEE